MDNHQLQIILESIDNKFQLVVEGHSSLVNQMAALEQKLTDRADITDFKIDTVADDLKATEARLTKKIDAVAADLKDHRADTEAHGGKGLYVVREG